MSILIPDAPESQSTQSWAEGPWLIEALLAEQQQLSAVEVFSREHEYQRPAQAQYYQSLLPASPPGPGQQYAFEVDLDRCSGCKACVTACHQLNGLDDGEIWRDVGLLTGLTVGAGELQHVTTACHHCLDPACVSACPVNAYEKDPVTGIVRHLDDQCFGCQYCTLACPYDVPKYHARLGIVRKCDMCTGRLAAGEAPACVQACPHEAIRITVVDTETTAGRAAKSEFLKGTIDSTYTKPSTLYRTQRETLGKLQPADAQTLHAEHNHWTLVVMLVLTQMSVGMFASSTGMSTQAATVLACYGMGVAMAGLIASTFHLGRPMYAFRGIIGIRHSWLSREILAFGAFAGAAMAYTSALLFHDLLPSDWAWTLPWLAAGAVATGVVGVFCSAMIYHVVRRPFWRLSRTLPKFVLTSVWLGCLAGAVVVSSQSKANVTPWLVFAVATGLGKLLFDAWEFYSLLDNEWTAARKSALLMIHDLKRITFLRYANGSISALLCTGLLLGQVSEVALTIGAVLAFVLAVAGELAERCLFFTAVVRWKMPGGLSL
jgi:Fe-S-cluster-containing dehydrogenase component/DMSO reductase anchor subunit